MPVVVGVPLIVAVVAVVLKISPAGSVPWSHVTYGAVPSVAANVLLIAVPTDPVKLPDGVTVGPANVENVTGDEE